MVGTAADWWVRPSEGWEIGRHGGEALAGPGGIGWRVGDLRGGRW
jgi:hypothetical protein